MPAIADLLDPAARECLAALGSPPTTAELAAGAREAAAESRDTGLIAWLIVAHALDKAAETTQAREHIATTVIDADLRALTLACLSALTSRNDTNTEEARTA